MDDAKMAQAYDKLDEALRWEGKLSEPGKDGAPKSEQVVRLTIKRVDKLLDEAVALESEALA